MGFRHRVARAIASVANMLVEEEGTLVVDTTNKKLFYHDGLQIGGHELGGGAGADPGTLLDSMKTAAYSVTGWESVDWNTITALGLHPKAVRTDAANGPNPLAPDYYTCTNYYNSEPIFVSDVILRQEAKPTYDNTASAAAEYASYYRFGSLHNGVASWSPWYFDSPASRGPILSSSAGLQLDIRKGRQYKTIVVNMVSNITLLSVWFENDYNAVIPIVFIQDATGGRTISGYNAAYNVRANEIPFLDKRPNAVTIMNLHCIKDKGCYLEYKTMPEGLVVASTTADVSSTVVALADVTQLAVTLEANCTYEVDCWIQFTGAVTTTGLQLGYTSPTGTLAFLEIRISLRNTASTATAQHLLFPAAAQANNGVVIGTGVSVINSPHTARINGILKVGANGGTFVPRFAAEIASTSVTIKTGSTIKLKRIA